MTMRALFKSWIERYFSDEEAVVLLLVLVLGFAAVFWLGKMLAPFFTALVLAFLLQGVVGWLERRGLPRLLSVLLVFLAFVGALLALALIVLPLVWNQLLELVQESPRMFRPVSNKYEISWKLLKANTTEKNFRNDSPSLQVVSLSCL